MRVTKKLVTQLAYDIIGCAINVHKELGPGLLESVYEKCLYFELTQNGFEVEKQVIVPVRYKGLMFNTDLRIDLLVNELVIVELKVMERIPPIYEAKLLTYMNLLEIPQGLLINFFSQNIARSYKPFVNEYFRSLPEG
jgi:GxxExxY protein